MTNCKNKKLTAIIKLIAIISISIVLLCILATFIIGISVKYDGNAETDDNTTSTTTAAISLIINGDVNNDGQLNVSDAVLLQKWLLAVPGIDLANWKAADLCEDDRLDAFDLCLVKRALVESKTQTTPPTTTTTETTTLTTTTTAKFTTTTINVEEYVNEIAMLVNAEREKKGIAPVKLNADLTEMAMIRAKEITTFFSHDRPDGSSCFSIFDDYNLSYSCVAENIAAGNPTPSQTMQQWINSEGHYKNLMNPNVSEIGVGFAYDPDLLYRYYWVQIFRG